MSMEIIMKGELHMSKRKNRDQSEMIKEPESYDNHLIYTLLVY